MSWATTKEGFPINDATFAAFFGGDVAAFVKVLNEVIETAYATKTNEPTTPTSDSTDKPATLIPKFDASSYSEGVTDISFLLDPST